MTKATRGRAAKLFKKTKSESQEGHEEEARAQRAAKQRAAAARKQEKMMKPRKEGVS